MACHDLLQKKLEKKNLSKTNNVSLEQMQNEKTRI